MFAVSIDLFTNISHVKGPGLAGFLHQLNKRFALSPDKASEIIAIWGLVPATAPKLSVTTTVQDFLTGLLRQQCP